MQVLVVVGELSEHVGKTPRQIPDFIESMGARQGAADVIGFEGGLGGQAQAPDTPGQETRITEQGGGDEQRCNQREIDQSCEPGAAQAENRIGTLLQYYGAEDPPTAHDRLGNSNHGAAVFRAPVPADRIAALECAADIGLLFASGRARLGKLRILAGLNERFVDDPQPGRAQSLVCRDCDTQIAGRGEPPAGSVGDDQAHAGLDES